MSNQYYFLVSSLPDLLLSGQKFKTVYNEILAEINDELSPADRELLALALEREGTVVTDDFAVQNTARELGITVQGILQRRARRIRWSFRCPGCGATAPGPGSCPVCGSMRERSH